MDVKAKEVHLDTTGCLVTLKVVRQNAIMQEREVTKELTFIHSFNKYLLGIDHIIDTVLDAEATVVNKTENDPSHQKVHILVGSLEAGDKR